MKQEPSWTISSKETGWKIWLIIQPNKFLNAFKSINTNTKTLQMYEW